MKSLFLKAEIDIPVEKVFSGEYGLSVPNMECLNGFFLVHLNYNPGGDIVTRCWLSGESLGAMLDWASAL